MSVSRELQFLPQILERYTNRSFVRMGKMSLEHMTLMLDAACRAGSSYNAQPWRFWYAQHSSSLWEQLFPLLVKPNAAWAGNAEWLVLVGAATKMTLRDEVIDNSSAHFDVGLACQNLVLQATFMGFGSAIIGGFNRAKASELIADADIHPVVMIALGDCSEHRPAEPSMRWPREEVSAHSFEKES